MAKKEETKIVEIPALELKTFKIKLIGDSPLITHKWDDKAKQMMLDKQTKKASKGREIRDPFREFISSMYWLTSMPKDINEENADEYIKQAKFGFPTLAFKAAAIDAGYQGGYTANKTMPRGAFHVLGEFVEIIGKPEIREDMVRIGMGTADLRYRAEFSKWEAIVEIKYNPRVMSIEQIINLFNIGGFGSGVGEWRPSKDGNFGMFHVGEAI